MLHEAGTWLGLWSPPIESFFSNWFRGETRRISEWMKQRAEEVQKYVAYLVDLYERNDRD